MTASDLGKGVLIVGGVLVVAGLVLMLGPKIPWLGRLPGDFSFETRRVKVYFPLATSVLISVLLSLALYVWHRLR